MGRGFVILTLATVLVVGATPAHATLEGLGVVTGTAAIGSDGPCAAGGQGLGLPVIHGANKNFSWRFVTSGVAAAPHAPVVMPVLVDMCGRLTSVAGIGAACGWSKGYDGIGQYEWVLPPQLSAQRTNVSTPPGTVITLRDLGWKLAVGGTWTILGGYEPVGSSKSGQFMALYQAQGGSPCLTKSATAYTIAGVFAMGPLAPVFWNQVTDPIDPKNDGPSGPLNPWGDKK